MASTLIYPSYLHYPKNYVYMPGHYLALATSYELLGYGAVQSLLPNLLAFVVTAAAVYVLARRLYGPTVGVLAALIVMTFPANVYYSLTAMSEGTLVAAVAVALAVFVHLPVQKRFLVGPLLVVLPVVFRETGALVAFPLGALILFERGRVRAAKAVVFLLLSGLVTLGILRSDLSGGRPPALRLLVFDGSFNGLYADAFAGQAINPRPQDWIVALAARAWANGRHVIDGPRYGADVFAPFEVLCVALILTGIPVGLLWGLRRRDPLALGTAGLVGALLLVVVSVHERFWAGAGLRFLLPAVPLVAVVWALAAAALSRWLGTRFPAASAPLRAGVVAGLGLMGLFLARQAFMNESMYQQEAARNVAFLDGVGHDPRLTLVTPHQIGLDWAYERWPAKWAFVPANRQSLELLDRRYPVGTIVAPDNRAYLSTQDVVQAGFRLEEQRGFAGERYRIFKKPPPEGQG